MLIVLAEGVDTQAAVGARVHRRRLQGRTVSYRAFTMAGMHLFLLLSEATNLLEAWSPLVKRQGHRPVRRSDRRVRRVR